VDDAYRMLRDPKCKGMLLDLQMPVVNSPGLLMVMSAEHARTPVIALTDNPDYEEEELKQFPNVKRLLLKPFYAEDLLAAVRHYMPKGLNEVLKFQVSELTRRCAEDQLILSDVQRSENLCALCGYSSSFMLPAPRPRVAAGLGIAPR
jgi:DNA-binding response OmpR family regulator